MARPQKTGLDYFPLDVDYCEDEKLFDIQNEYGCLGEVIYLRLLCMVYKNGYYYKFECLDKLAAMLIRSIGNKWIGNRKIVKQVICALGDANLFDKGLLQANVITSGSIQRRYLKACERRQSLNGSLEYWIAEDANPKVSATKTRVNVAETRVNVAETRVFVDSNSTKNGSKIKHNSLSVIDHADEPTTDKPTLDQLHNYCRQNGVQINELAFFEYNDARGWKRPWKYLLAKWVEQEERFSASGREFNKHDRPIGNRNDFVTDFDQLDCILNLEEKQ